MFSFVLAGLLGYLLGSLPTAFLIVRWKSKLDIRSAGSGNVGTLNSYQVTGSFLVGAAVLALDAAKGIGAVLLAGALPDHDFSHKAVAGVCSILGHNFPVWIGFRGGRGLATAAAVVSLFCWPAVGVWGVFWCAGYLVFREVNPANAAATLIFLLIAACVPAGLLERYTAEGVGAGEFRIFALAALIPVLVKHLEPVRAYILERRAARRRRHDTRNTGQS